MNDWKKCSVGDILTLHYGKALPISKRTRGIIPVYSSAGLTGWHNKPLVKSKGLIIGRKGTIGKIYKSEKPFFAIDTVYYVKPDVDKYDLNFLYYLFQQLKLENLNEDSAVPGLNRNTVYLQEIYFPPLSEQKKIAEVLSSLDDKIDLLHRQNKTLEALAETIFRQKFVEEISENWEHVKLEKFVDCYKGVSYKSSELKPSKIALVTLKNFNRDGGFRLDGFKEFFGKFKKSQIVKQGDIIVAHTDITQDAVLIGNPALVVAIGKYSSLVISMDVVKVSESTDWLLKSFLYYLMKSPEFKKHCLAYSNGSTVLHLSKTAIPSFEFFLPPKEKIAEFCSIADNIISKIFVNIDQIQSLKSIRDTLLPKLIHHEVKVITS